MAEILVVDDEQDIRDLLGDFLEDEGHKIMTTGQAREAIDLVEQNQPELVILDIWLKESDLDGIDILKHIKTKFPKIPVIIISGHGTIEIAVVAVKQGAYDFIEKPFNFDQLLIVVNRALEVSELRRTTGQKQEIPSFPELIGSSTAMKSLRTQLEKLAKTQGRVLFQGLAGSGKEASARYLHSLSERGKLPFIVVNCASVTPEDFDRQFFGSENASKVIPGVLERANGGTLFLDEVGELPYECQSKLLKVLNEQQFERMGSNKLVPVDVRVMSSTKYDLEARIGDGRFREELYHRLNVVPIEVPSLNLRRSDIPELVEFFVDKLHAHEFLPKRNFTKEALEALQSFDWPGNIREFRNRIERILILHGESDEIQPEHVLASEASSESDASLSNEYLFLPLREARELFEQRYLVSQINRFSGNVSKTANYIGMERSALHRKMKSLNIVSNAKGAELISDEECEQAEPNEARVAS